MDDEDFGAYRALSDQIEDHRWAFGTGFTDPLEGVDTTVPSGVDGDALAAYCLMLGDDALIYSHRLQEWITRAPELEEETALANIALDLLGQARLLLTRAGRADGSGRDEDDFAFWRGEGDFRNVRMVERLDHDFAELVARLLVFSTWRLALLASCVVRKTLCCRRSRPRGSRSSPTTATTRPSGWSGSATAPSCRTSGCSGHSRALWPLVDELFTGHDVERSLPGVAVDAAALRPEFDATIDTVLAAAGLDRPEVAPLAGVGERAGRDGRHTEAMGQLLAELQSVARADPEATW